ncbi:PAS-domain containing protein [Bradyrhizobium sp. WSM1743]|uniref:PAS-domain containing protein n=1 Tax=Bradyrhizobium sp. WSM1743 TaxID=318996 RepID=UPI0004028CA2|nr:PAS-domain containing protein [Bradyrhizobium sp. WSM1743]
MRKARSAQGRSRAKTKQPVRPATRMKPSRAFEMEAKEAREQQAAAAEILKVIASSPSDVQPVFEAIASSAKRLLGGYTAAVYRLVDDAIHLVALTPTSPEADKAIRAEFPVKLNRAAPPVALAANGEFVQIADSETADLQTQRLGRTRGWRSVTFTPLLNKGAAIGFITITRRDPGAFADHHVQLLQTFANQAAIAIENTRLFDERREALERQTATGDVLKIISRSSVDLETVLETLVETVARLCRADQVYMFHLRHDLWHLIADYGLSIEAREFFKTNPFTPGRGSTSGRAAMELRAVPIADVLQDPEYTLGEGQAIAGYRSTLGVPLLRENTLIGVFSIARTRVEPFASKDIELATSFADQAVIAIENARLFDELRERQAELRVTFDNMGDAVAMFGADKRLAAWNRNLQDMLDLPDDLLVSRPNFAELFRYLAARGEFGSGDLEAELARSVDDIGREMRYERVRPDGRIVEVRRNPVPDGGFVLIYADITKRKRSEDAVRMARDAAEKALLDLQAAQDRLIQTEKLASLGQLTAGIAHEIKNPLNFVNNFSALSVELTDELNDLLKQATLTEQLRKEVDELTALLKNNLSKVVQHGKRADSIVKNMLLHSREGSGELRAVDINGLVEESLNLAYHGARAEKPGFNIVLQRNLDPAAGMADVYPQAITRALLNLISNGFYAATKRKTENGEAGFEPILSATTTNLGSSVGICIRDNGIGIPSEVKEKIFNPFFTTKPAGEGTGLGLSMTHDIIVKQHGGTIRVETEPGAFTDFIVTLPRASGAQSNQRSTR